MVREKYSKFSLEKIILKLIILDLNSKNKPKLTYSHKFLKEIKILKNSNSLVFDRA